MHCQDHVHAGGRHRQFDHPRREVQARQKETL